MLGDAMVGGRPDQQYQSGAHDSQPGIFRQLRRPRQPGKYGLEDNAVSEPQQHLATEQQHATLVEHIVDTVVQARHIPFMGTPALQPGCTCPAAFRRNSPEHPKQAALNNSPLPGRLLVKSD